MYYKVRARSKSESECEREREEKFKCFLNTFEMAVYDDVSKSESESEMICLVHKVVCHQDCPCCHGGRMRLCPRLPSDVPQQISFLLNCSDVYHMMDELSPLQDDERSSHFYAPHLRAGAV